MASERNHFPHRRNPDGTYDSICTECFRTIFSSRIEDELDGPDQEHVCSSEDIFRYDRTGASMRSWRLQLVRRA